jgi:hypothetical protein
MTKTSANEGRGEATRSRDGWGWLAGLAGWLVLTGAFYTWTATSAGSPYEPMATAGDYYDYLVDAVLAGQTSLLIEADPRLAGLSDPWAKSDGVWPCSVFQE